MLDQTTNDLILRQMNYRDGMQCCKVCRHFVGVDCSGEPGANGAHCTLSPAFDLPVEESGVCDHFAAGVK
jgi:hypothetical protein